MNQSGSYSHAIYECAFLPVWYVCEGTIEQCCMGPMELLKKK